MKRSFSPDPGDRQFKRQCGGPGYHPHHVEMSRNTFQPPARETFHPIFRSEGTVGPSSTLFTPIAQHLAPPPYRPPNQRFGFQQLPPHAHPLPITIHTQGGQETYQEPPAPHAHHTKQNPFFQW